MIGWIYAAGALITLLVFTRLAIVAEREHDIEIKDMGIISAAIMWPLLPFMYIAVEKGWLE